MEYYPDAQNIRYRNPEVFVDYPDSTIPINTDPDLLAYEYIGKGLLENIGLRVSDHDIIITLEIDGIKVLNNFDLDKYKKLVHSNFQTLGFIRYFEPEDIFEINPKVPFSFKNSFRILLRSSNNHTEELEAIMVTHTKE